MLNVWLVGFPSGGTGQGIADAGPPLLANISLWEIHASLPRKQGTRLGDRHTRGVKEFNPISLPRAMKAPPFRAMQCKIIKHANPTHATAYNNWQNTTEATM